MKTRLTITHETEVKLPAMPNFIECDGQNVDVKNMDTATLCKIADSWKQALLLHAKERGKSLSDGGKG